MPGFTWSHLVPSSTPPCTQAMVPPVCQCRGTVVQGYWDKLTPSAWNSVPAASSILLLNPQFRHYYPLWQFLFLSYCFPFFITFCHQKPSCSILGLAPPIIEFLDSSLLCGSPSILELIIKLRYSYQNHFTNYLKNSKVLKSDIWIDSLMRLLEC